MGGIDLGDQLEAYYEPGYQLYKHWHALFRWLLGTTVTNCWLLWDRRGTQRKPKLKHRDFIRQIALRLLKPVKAPEFRRHLQLQETIYQVPSTQHEQGRLPKKSYYVFCRSTGSTRSILQVISNNKRRRRPPQSNFGCLTCNKHLCKGANCWNKHLEALSSM